MGRCSGVVCFFFAITVVLCFSPWSGWLVGTLVWFASPIAITSVVLCFFPSFLCLLLSCNSNLKLLCDLTVLHVLWNLNETNALWGVVCYWWQKVAAFLGLFCPLFSSVNNLLLSRMWWWSLMLAKRLVTQNWMLQLLSLWHTSFSTASSFIRRLMRNILNPLMWRTPPTTARNVVSIVCMASLFHPLTELPVNIKANKKSNLRRSRQ